MEAIDVPVKVGCVLDDGSIPPGYAHDDDAGADLTSTEDVEIEPFGRALIGTGVHLDLPDGKLAWVTPRSGLAVKRGLTVLNAPGLVDTGYHGEVKVCLINLDPDGVVKIRRGDRIAQLVIQDYDHAHFEAVTETRSSDRGSNGFGSTGVSD